MTLPQHAQGFVQAATSLPAQLVAAGAGFASSLLGWIVAESPDVATQAIGTGRYAIVVAALSLIGKVASDVITAWNQRRKDELANKLDMYKAETDRKIAEMDRQREQERESRAVKWDLTSAQLMAQEARTDKIDARTQSLKDGVKRNGLAIGTIGDAVGVPVEPAVPPDDSGEHATLR
jgi:hypothetical protein